MKRKKQIGSEDAKEGVLPIQQLSLIQYIFIIFFARMKKKKRWKS